MPKFTLGFFLIITFITTYAQEVISTQGDSYINESGTMDFTIGEVVIHTSTNLTQGFHQTNWNFVGQEYHVSSFDVVIFPNPTEDILNIQTTAFKNVTYSIYDALGKLVLRDKLFVEQTSIGTSHLSSGFYSLILSYEEKRLRTFKLVKVK
ncbi:T9SS type A sorting domain-containing protein [Aquimarina sp. 2201CG1-2-11]|uniref:T9SS type A sorting domain-containing protein n=1 Tax=Aquimarina discodermiae TaxID=3231043 RepID=UPI00346263AC